MYWISILIQRESGTARKTAQGPTLVNRVCLWLLNREIIKNKIKTFTKLLWLSALPDCVSFDSTLSRTALSRTQRSPGQSSAGLNALPDRTQQDSTLSLTALSRTHCSPGQRSALTQRSPGQRSAGFNALPIVCCIFLTHFFGWIILYK